MRVEQLMSRGVRTCRADDSLHSAARIMWECDVGCVPVVDVDNRVVGMITDRDITMAAYLQGLPIGSIRVESAMAKQLHICRPEDTVASVEARMRQHQVRRFPVVDASGQLAGLVSMNDLALEAARERGMRRPEVSLDELALTLAGVCEHRAPESLARS